MLWGRPQGESVHCQTSGRGRVGGGVTSVSSRLPFLDPNGFSFLPVALWCCGLRGELFLPSQENLETSLKD